jgi:hypothetical protein
MLLTGVELGDEGTVVVKRASGDDGVEALRREGERLRRAAHPGVVPVVRSGPTADGWELVLSHGGRPLSTCAPLAPAAAGGVAASVASTLADLHDLGIVHGRLDATHVLLGDQGRPVLCGFGDGATAAGRPDDVAALGRLLSDLLGATAEPDLIPERRWRALRSRPAWERRALLAVADLALAEPPERRPSARALAAALADAVPTAGASRVAHPRDPGPDPIERLRPAHAAPPVPARRTVAAPLGAAALAAGALIVLGVAGLRDRSSPSVGTRSPAGRITATAAPVEGSVITAGGRRYRVGQPGDHLLVDDWRCDGRPVPAILRPSTHEVFVFERWAEAGPVSVPPVVTVAGATQLVSQDRGDGCPELAVVVQGRPPVPIDLGDAP